MSPTQISLIRAALLGCAAADASAIAGTMAGSHVFLALCLLPSLVVIAAYLPGQCLQRQIGRRVSPVRVAQVNVAAFALAVLCGLAFPSQTPADLPLVIGVLGVAAAFAAAQTWARTNEAKALTLPAVGILALGIWLAMSAVRLASGGQALLAASMSMLAVGAALAAMSLLQPGKHEDDHCRRSRDSRNLVGFA